MKIIPLHNHSEYSIRDSILRVGDIVAFAQQENLHSIALTDRNNLYGAIKFYKKARAAGIKPILGCDLSVRSDGNIHQLILLAMNEAGFHHLNELISFAYEYDQIGEEVAVNSERFTREQCEGLIALSGGLQGDVGLAVLAEDLTRAKNCAAHWQSIFGDRYYLQISRVGQTGEAAYFDAAQQIGAELGIAAVATNLACFQAAEDYDVHEVRVCITTSRLKDDPTRPHLYTEKNHLCGGVEMAMRFADASILLENSEAIAKRCNLILDLGHNYLPDFPLPDGMKIEEYLVEASEKGLEERLVQLFPDDTERAEKAPTYRERLATELGVINQMGFPGYFLIVADFIQWAKDNDVPVGPGRGSGAGSLVAYALKITDLDPLAYDLLFERFLNPERVSMPDFDVDFCMDKRDRVIRYVSEKYGHEKVSQIATHGTMAAKAVIRDVGRVLGMPYPECDRISKMVPKTLGVTLPDALGFTEKSKKQLDFYSPELRESYDTDENTRELIDISLQLEGLARNVGKHAGGVVIAPTRLTDFSPLYTESAHAGLVTQFDKDDIEATGLVKFDFLGLRTLTVIDWALAHVNRRHQREGKPPLNINHIAMDDSKTFALLKSAKTSAVFQLESQGMKGLISKLKPDNFEDIIALVALFRPGPLGSGMVDDFINRKHGLAEVSYPHPALAQILENTYGVMVYQEQVMQVAQILANYSLGEADLLRRAMGKKKAEVMVEQKAIFCERAIAGGVDAKVANDIFDLMAKFAEYGFNKSHSAAYALLSYQTAWLKAHYPAELMAAVLTSDMDKIEKVVPMVGECQDMGLKMLPPCINRSLYRFTVNEDGAILFGLGAVKGVGEGAVKTLIDEREANGPYTSILDICRRIDLKTINKNTLESLIQAGAFDNIEPNRGALYAALPEAIKLANQHHKQQSSKQVDMFGMFASSEEDNRSDNQLLDIRPEQAWDLRYQLECEKKALGLYLTGHPVDIVKDAITALCPKNLAAITAQFSEAPELPEPKLDKDGKPRRRFLPTHHVKIGGLVTEYREITSKTGTRMAFFTLEDASGRLELGLFGEKLEQLRGHISVDAIVLVEAQVSYTEKFQNWRYAAQDIIDLEEAQYRQSRHIVIHTDTAHFENGGFELLKRLQQSENNDNDNAKPIYLHLNIPENHTRGELRLQGRYHLDANSLKLMKSTFGDQVHLRY